MKNIEDKFMFVFYGLFGAFLGFLIFAVGLGGWEFLFIDRPAKPWNGTIALILCTTIGGGWGLLAYKLRHHEFASSRSSLYEDPATAILFSKRVMVIVTCLAGLYFIWQLARGL